MRALIILSMVLAGGCAGEGEEPIDLVADLEIGSASAAGLGFLPVLDGDDVELIPGSQGGFHVWTGLRVKGAKGELYLDREARLASDGTLVLRAQEQYLEVPDAAMEGWWERDEAAASFMCPAPVGITIYDSALDFTARLYDGDGELLAEDSVTLTPVCPTGEQESICQTICDG